MEKFFIDGIYWSSSPSWQWYSRRFVRKKTEKAPSISAADRLKVIADEINEKSPDLEKISKHLKDISDINARCGERNTAIALC